jgi:hypothetical protein
MARRIVLAALGGACLAVLAAWPPAMAQKPPGPVALEALVKATLLTFNDANITGNYTVFHARLAKPFREQFAPEKLKEVFSSFSEQGIDVEIIAALKPTLTDEPQVDDRGALLLRGYFDTSPNRVTFLLDFIQSEGGWKLININVKVKPAGE